MALSTGEKEEGEKTTGQILVQETPHLAVFRVGFVLAVVFMLVPVAIVVLAALNAGEYLTFPPQGLSLRWISHFLSSPVFLPAFLLSLMMAGITALVSMTIGTMAAIFLSRVNFPGRGFVQSFFLTPIMLPGMVLGLALYLYYLNLDIGLSRTLTGLIIGHILVSTPFVIGTVGASMHGFDMALEEAARSLGAGPVTAFFKVTLPNIKSGIMAGFLFAFIVSFGQFDVSLFLSTPDNTPLPIAMYYSLRFQFDPTAAAAGTFAIMLVTGSMILTSRLTNLGRLFSSGLKFG